MWIKAYEGNLINTNFIREFNVREDRNRPGMWNLVAWSSTGAVAVQRYQKKITAESALSQVEDIIREEEAIFTVPDDGDKSLVYIDSVYGSGNLAKMSSGKTASTGGRTKRNLATRR